MSKIVLSHVSKRFGNYYAVDDLNLTIEDKSFLTILGPSGCGKTTTLRMIAGLETPTSGKITIDGETVFSSNSGINVDPAKRNIGFLFQNYALWPHMTVYQNIAFGLENVKGDFPLLATTCWQAERFGEIFSEPSLLRQCFQEARHENGKVDEKKALLNLIETFHITSFMAQSLLMMKFSDLTAPEFASFVGEQAQRFRKSQDEELVKWEEKGFEVDEKFVLSKDGKPVIKNRRLDKGEIDIKVYEVASTLHISEFLDRYPNELSGGQQQRVAVARTLALGSKIIFMDEPLSNLDAQLRLEMRSELKRLHLDTGATFVYVTHDQQEAMTLSSKICLLNNGVLQQVDTPLEVYQRPANLFVANFVGSPSLNFLNVKVSQEKNGLRLSFFEGGFEGLFEPNIYVDLPSFVKKRDQKAAEEAERASEKTRDKHYVEKENRDKPFVYPIRTVTEDRFASREQPVLSDEDLVLAIRPEFVRIEDEGPIEGEVYSALPSGSETIVRIRVDKFLLTAIVYGVVDYRVGSKARLSFATSGLLLYDRQSQRLICQGLLSSVSRKN